MESKTNEKSSTRFYPTLCYSLIIILNLSTWIDLNGIWVQLPLIVNKAPERWTLPSTLSLVISLANIFPILLVILRWRLGKRFNEIPFIYIIIVVGVIACISIGLFWEHHTYLFGQERSLALIGSVFALAILDCTSSLVFCDHMKRYKAHYLQAMFIGESLTGTLPTLIALFQGVGGEYQCVYFNETTNLQPIYSIPRFSVSIFFYLISLIIFLSLFAFFLLHLTPIIQLAKAEHKKPIDREESELKLKLDEISIEQRKLSVSTSDSMLIRDFYILQAFNVLNSGILYGCLPTLITYSVLPYGQKAFYYCSILFPIAGPLAALYGIRRPTLTISSIITGSLFGTLISIFIIVIAFQSPCPLWADTFHGAVLVISAWFVSSFVFSYVRIVSGNSIKRAWGNENGLFYFGLSVQMGVLFGVLPMYLLINIFQVLKDRQPCVVYCQ